MNPRARMYFLPSRIWRGEGPDTEEGLGLLTDGHTILDFLPAAAAPADARHFPGGLLTPAFTNFHCHLELSDVPRPPYPGSFTRWLTHVMAAGPKTGEAAAQAAAQAVRACHNSGVAEVYDLTRFPAHTRQALGQEGAGLRVHSCGEITGLGAREPNGAPMLAAALAPPPPAATHVTRALAPHATYSTSAHWFRAAGDAARAHAIPLTTHLAETPAEREFLASHTGEFARLWQLLGGLGPDVDDSPLGPIHHLEALDFFRDTHVLAAHANDVTDDELSVLARRQVTVVHCPRTHAYFRRDPFDIARFTAAGICVKLGTDSAASAGDLRLLSDVQEFWRLNPALPPHVLLQMVIARPLLIGGPFPGFNIWPVQSLDELARFTGMPAFRLGQGAVP